MPTNQLQDETKSTRYWVWRSSSISTRNQKISVSACLETVLATLIALLIGYRYNCWLLISISVTIAPLLLLRTNVSIKLGIQCVKRFDSDRYSYDKRGGRYISGLLLAVWALILLLFIRIYATLIVLLKLRLKVVRQVPNNWRYYALCLDTFHMPEAVVGLDDYIRKHPEDKQLSKLTINSLYNRLISRNKNKPMRIIVFRLFVYSWVFICLFASSIAFRWSIKSSSIVYAPFIYLSNDIGLKSSNLLIRANKIINKKFVLYWSIIAVMIIFAALPILLATLMKSLNDYYSNNILLSTILNYLTFTPHIERWNLARVLCAIITIIMYIISRLSIKLIERNNSFMYGRIGRIFDGTLRILHLIRSVGVLYVLLCGIILFWSILPALGWIASVKLVLPEIGSRWFPSATN